MKFLNTPQYLEMRREAFLNDGISPTRFNAPDLLVWDTSRYTNWTDELIGGNAQVYNIQGSISGWNQRKRSSRFVLDIIRKQQYFRRTRATIKQIYCSILHIQLDIFP